MPNDDRELCKYNRGDWGFRFSLFETKISSGRVRQIRRSEELVGLCKTKRREEQLKTQLNTTNPGAELKFNS